MNWNIITDTDDLWVATAGAFGFKAHLTARRHDDSETWELICVMMRMSSEIVAVLGPGFYLSREHAIEDAVDWAKEVVPVHPHEPPREESRP